MMTRAFTLIELLVVVGIMGLLGTVSVGGYRAMQRGMAEKGVMQNVSTLIKTAYQRAQVDRQPTAVFFWNETLKSATDDDNEVVVGKAVAVRRAGRITRCSGQLLGDEFADLERGYPTEDEVEGGSNKDSARYLYPMDRLSDIESSSDIRRSKIEGKVYWDDVNVIYLFGNGTRNENLVALNDSDYDEHLSDEKTGKIGVWSFKLIDQNGVSWRPGMAYGFEFATLELPPGFIFGSSYSKQSDDPVRPAGSLVFDVGYNDGTKTMRSGSQAGVVGQSSVSIYALRPGDKGELTAKLVGATGSPTKE